MAYALGVRVPLFVDIFILQKKRILSGIREEQGKLSPPANCPKKALLEGSDQDSSRASYYEEVSLELSDEVFLDGQEEASLEQFIAMRVHSSVGEQSAFNRQAVGSSPTEPTLIWMNGRVVEGISFEN